MTINLEYVSTKCVLIAPPSFSLSIGVEVWFVKSNSLLHCGKVTYTVKLKQSILVKMSGLNVPMAVLLLAGEMAGLGVLALPHSMIGTGPAGFFLIIYFTINAIFVGQRLGMCWTMIERMFPEYRDEVGS